ncbi:MAG: cupredoxin domain-containing protein [bacterium]|nr:cupredoxin domain-containing protein [bacterium]
MNKNATIGIIVVVVLILIGGFMLANRTEAPAVTDNIDTGASSAAPTGSASPSVSPSASATPSASVGAGVNVSTGAVKSFTVTSSNFKFSPTEIRVKKGDRVKVTLNNTNGFHDFVIDEFNARTKQINGAGTDTIEFVASKTGTFEYYCSVGNHRQMGMVGKIIVE